MDSRVRIGPQHQPAIRVLYPTGLYHSSDDYLPEFNRWYSSQNRQHVAFEQP